FVEIYQNCNVYNDGAFDAVKEEKENQIRLEHGQPVRFGAEGEKGVVMRSDGACELVEVAAVGEETLLVHDEHQEEGSLAYSLSRISHTPHGPTPIGIFRDIERPVYDRLMAEQLETAKAERGTGELASLLQAGDTWNIP
ncbi:MAG: 2-oxoacid:ferredoxin oxidoreductase subunit beta, partial [Gaiellaceae bacterium]